jgi:hypothetical protein
MTLDQICQMTRNPTVLNALHACRPDHPWNKTTKNPWYSAYFVAMQQPSYEINCAACDWLYKQAMTNGEISK